MAQKYQVACWPSAKCRICGKTSHGFSASSRFAKLFRKIDYFRGNDAEVDCLCIKCFSHKENRLKTGGF